MVTLDLTKPDKPRILYTYAAFVEAHSLVSALGLDCSKWFVETSEEEQGIPLLTADLSPLRATQREVVRAAVEDAKRFASAHARRAEETDFFWLEEAWTKAKTKAPDVGGEDTGESKLHWLFQAILIDPRLWAAEPPPARARAPKATPTPPPERPQPAAPAPQAAAPEPARPAAAPAAPAAKPAPAPPPPAPAPPAATPVAPVAPAERVVVALALSGELDVKPRLDQLGAAAQLARVAVASPQGHLLFFSNKGKVFARKVSELAEATNRKAAPLTDLVKVQAGETIAAMIAVDAFTDPKFVVTLARGAVIKKTELSAYASCGPKGTVGAKIEEGDELVSALLADEDQHLFVATRKGVSIRFPVDTVRQSGRDALGVNAMTVESDDTLACLAVTDKERPQVLAVCENGYGKRTSEDEYRVQSRGGRGLTLIQTSERNGPVIGVLLVGDADEVALISNQGRVMRVPASEIKLASRNVQGTKLAALRDGEKLVGLHRLT